MVSLRSGNFDLTSLENGVEFDLNGDGTTELTPWSQPQSDDTFLVLDRNRNGIVDSGSELFTDSSPQHPSERPSGFNALAIYDDRLNGGNEDGRIDPSDAFFSELRLWRDANHDGVSSPEELLTLDEVGLLSISLQFRETSRRDRYGNWFRYWAEATWRSGASRPVWNVFFGGA